MRTSAFFGAKDFGFFEIYGVSARTGGRLNQCGHFVNKNGGGQFFAILCGHLLWTVPKAYYAVTKPIKNISNSLDLNMSRRDMFRFRSSFVKVPRPGDSEVTFAVFKSSCHLLLPV